jgi:hypothetical protein
MRIWVVETLPKQQTSLSLQREQKPIYKSPANALVHLALATALKVDKKALHFIDEETEAELRGHFLRPHTASKWQGKH